MKFLQALNRTASRRGARRVRRAIGSGASISLALGKRLSVIESLEPRNLLAAGAPDPSFGDAGIVATPFNSGQAIVSVLAVEPDGKIVAAGRVESQGFAVARYNTDGSLDASFGDGWTFVV